MFSVRLRKLSKSLTNVLRLSHSFFDDQVNAKKLKLIKTFDKTVDPFSKIYIETPMHVRITPLDLLDHPDGDKLMVSLYSHEKDNSTKITIKQTAKRIDVTGNKTDSENDAVCVINAPISASFEVKALGKSSISIDKMHSETCHLRTASGFVRAKNIRGRSITIRSESGPVVCEGTLQAEKIDIQTSIEDIICQHIRANILKIATQGGDISCESCYSDEAHISTAVGSIKLANLHSKCVLEILESGDLSVTGFNGCINAISKRGNIHLQASRLTDKSSIFLHESGIADVRISDDLKSMNSIEVIAGKLNIEEEIAVHGNIVDDQQQKIFRYENPNIDEPPKELHIECRNGSVDLKLSSWMKNLEDTMKKHPS